MILIAHPAASRIGMTVSLTTALPLPFPPMGLTSTKTRLNGLISGRRLSTAFFVSFE
jgi:hypothetical protein